MKKIFNKALKLTLVCLILISSSCENDLYEEQIRRSNESKLTFEQFKKETRIDNFKILRILESVSETNKDFQLENEFLTDTLGIIKYTSIDNKVTYSFKIYPITELLDAKEYYNLVYEKYGNEWNEIIFKNTEKEIPIVGESKLEESKMVYNKKYSTINMSGFCQAINYSNGNCTCSDKSNCDWCSECISQTVSYVYCGGLGDDLEADPLHISTGDSPVGGGGTDYSGIYIPNPYDGEASLNNPEFVLATQVAAFTRTLSASSPAIKTLLQNNFWLFPNIIEFVRNNGGMTSSNMSSVTFALNNVIPIVNLYFDNLTSNQINQTIYNAFIFLLHNPNNIGSNFIKSIVIENQIDDSQLDPCTKGIINRLKGLQSSDISRIINKLEVANFIQINPIYNTKIIIEDPINSPNAMAQTNLVTISNSNGPQPGQGVPLRFSYIIKVRPSYLNGTMLSTTTPPKKPTQLAIARTILHEIIHAYLDSIFDDCFVNNNCTEIEQFSDLWNAYITYINNGTYPSNAQHLTIANNFIKILASALQEYQIGNPVAENEEPQQVYQDLAWKGLESTPIFNEKYPPGSPEYNRFREVNNAEDKNESYNSGSLVNPLSTPCN